MKIQDIKKVKAYLDDIEQLLSKDKLTDEEAVLQEVVHFRATAILMRLWFRDCDPCDFALGIHRLMNENWKEKE